MYKKSQIYQTETLALDRNIYIRIWDWKLDSFKRSDYVQTTFYNLWNTMYNLQIKNYNLQFINYNLQFTNYKL